MANPYNFVLPVLYEMKAHEIQSYKLRELWIMEGSKRTYRTFQKERNKFVRVNIPIGWKTQVRYLDREQSYLARALGMAKPIK